MRLMKTIALAVALVTPLFAVAARAEIDIVEVTSPSGIKAWLVEDHNIPFTALELRFRGGTSLDAPEKRGAVNLMTALLEEGTGDLDSPAFARARDSLAARYGFGADEDGVAVSARFLSENRDAAVDLLHRALVSPAFSAEAIERVRGQVLANIRASEKSPSAIASKRFSAMAYGDHPYATSGDGTADTVAALNREDILAAHRGALAKDRLYVAAAGDISPDELGLLIDRLLEGMPEQGAALPEAAELRLTGGTTVVDFPGPQSTVIFGHQGIKRDDPDYFAATILNEVLGGGRFSARLMDQVRDKRGLTYGISSYLVGYDHAELVMGQFSSANRTTAEAIDVVKEQWHKIAMDAITPEELAATKTYLTGSYPLRFDGNGTIASILVGMQLIGLDKDYPKTRNAKIDAITLDDVQRVAKRLYHPDALRFVVVGEPEGLTSSD